MIVESEISVIGRTLKPHGINGEIAATIDAPVNLDSLRCIILDIDGIYVPFFIKSYRYRASEAVLISIDGVRDEKDAAALCGLDIHALKSDLGEDDDHGGDDGLYLSDLVGYTLLDQDGRKIGEIDGYDDSTANSLLTVSLSDGATVYVPIADELVEDIDTDQRTISLQIPQGLLDL